MEIKENKDKDKLENFRADLRSKKVRDLLGEAPNKMLSWGIGIIIVIFFLIFCFVLSFSYPHGKGESIFQHYFSTWF